MKCWQGSIGGGIWARESVGMAGFVKKEKGLFSPFKCYDYLICQRQINTKEFCHDGLACRGA